MVDRRDYTISSGPDEEELKDIWCDPDDPIVIKFEDVSAAAFRIKHGIIMTPCDASHMNSDLGLEMFFKKDYMQFTGSFKVCLIFVLSKIECY